MKLEAIYDQGKLEFISPVRLKSERFRVKVEVPDEEIEGASAPESDSSGLPEGLGRQAREMLDRFAAIRNAPLPPDIDLPELTSKQEERIEAFALREEIKGMR
jgi:hypothetical protein